MVAGGQSKGTVCVLMQRALISIHLNLEPAQVGKVQASLGNTVRQTKSPQLPVGHKAADAACDGGLQSGGKVEDGVIQKAACVSRAESTRRKVQAFNSEKIRTFLAKSV